MTVTQASVQERLAAEESELLARLRAGDERAFEALVERFYRPCSRSPATT
jgi:hypothetical protein